ncbi:MAG TPA: bifunctional oligoribonuclease/PAP phosphatase NrnA [Fimbriimonadaceae bacterium]|nr:bifunctional oligoribonuclease/PAP phosphatase NrnA [Fimbriimonadaceae bacterium]
MLVTPELALAFRAEVEAASSIIVGTHLNPDGDALGSALAMSHFLDDLGKPHQVFCNNPAPYNLRFLPGAGRVQLEGTVPPGTLGIVLDLDALHRLGRVRPLFEQCKRLIVVDHHVPHEKPGDLRIIDPESPATALILTDLLLACHAVIRPEIATCLLAGIVTDTGSFRFPNTTPHALTRCADLLACGGDIVRIGEELYQKKPLPAVKLLGTVLHKMRLELDAQIGWATLSTRDYAAAHATEEHTEGLVNEILSVDSVRIAALIREPQPGKVRASIRSRGEVDVTTVARVFGGGGHRNAAGCTFEVSLEEAERGLVREMERCLASS